MFLNVPMSFTSCCQMCSGTTARLAYGILSCGCLVLMTNVVAFGADTLAKFPTSAPSAVAAAWLVITRL